jgi:hypothetical protein
VVDRIPWEQFKQQFRWKQGEHVAAIAPTGAGKTTLMSELMQYRKYNIMFGTKPADKLYDEILKKGFRRIESIHDVKPWDEKVLLWPHQRETIKQTTLAQRESFMDALNIIVKQRSWTVWMDEVKYIAQFLGLAGEVTYCLEQLRSIDATIICGAQRPAWLPLSVLSNSSHVFIWKTTFNDDAKRLADIGGVDSKEVAALAKTLDTHEFLYIHTRGTEAKIIRSQVERK